MRSIMSCIVLTLLLRSRVRARCAGRRVAICKACDFPIALLGQLVRHSSAGSVVALSRALANVLRRAMARLLDWWCLDALRTLAMCP
jgi:hypothetical protein